MENPSKSRPDPEFSKQLMQMLSNICVAIHEIRDLLKNPPREIDDQDIEDIAVHFLIQCGPNLSEIARKMQQQGIPVRRQSLAEAKKFSRFQEKLEIFRSGEIHNGYRKDDGSLEAQE